MTTVSEHRVPVPAGTEGLGIPSDRIGNPHRVPLSSDRVIGNRAEIPRWNESGFQSAWDSTSKVGLFVHFGRCPQDGDLFWGQILVYLPDGTIAVDRSWGRSEDPDEINTGNLNLRLDNPHRGWKIRFDGAAQRTTKEVMAAGPVGAGPKRPLRFALETEAIGPVWDLYAAKRLPGSNAHQAGVQDWATGSHTQQVNRHTGTLTFDGTEYTLNGLGANDHSSGLRDMSTFRKEISIMGALPGKTMHVTKVWGPDDVVMIDAATLFGPDDEREEVTVDIPPLENVLGDPRQFQIAITDSAGTKNVIDVEVEATTSITYTDDGDNINGIDWDGADTLILNESRVKLTLPDGITSHVFMERSSRTTHLAKP